VHEVCRRVGSRQCHSDDEVSCSESQEDENKRFTTPFRKQLFQHRNRALTIWAHSGNPTIEGKCGK
jgi:hypothetical protein